MDCVGVKTGVIARHPAHTELKIVALRRKAEQRLGTKLNVREFQDVVLRNGATPLAILEEEVNAWIAPKR